MRRQAAVKLYRHSSSPLRAFPLCSFAVLHSIKMFIEKWLNLCNLASRINLPGSGTSIMKKTALELTFHLINCWGLYVAQICQPWPSGKAKKLLKDYLWCFIPLLCLKTFPPNREPPPLESVTSELGVLLSEATGRKGCPLMMEKRRASPLVELFK